MEKKLDPVLTLTKHRRSFSFFTTAYWRFRSGLFRSVEDWRRDPETENSGIKWYIFQPNRTPVVRHPVRSGIPFQCISTRSVVRVDSRVGCKSVHLPLWRNTKVGGRRLSGVSSSEGSTPGFVAPRLCYLRVTHETDLRTGCFNHPYYSTNNIRSFKTPLNNGSLIHRSCASYVSNDTRYYLRDLSDTCEYLIQDTQKTETSLDLYWVSLRRKPS